MEIPETHNTSHVIFETAVDKVATFTVCCLRAKVRWKGSTAPSGRGRRDLHVIVLFVTVFGEAKLQKFAHKFSILHMQIII